MRTGREGGSPDRVLVDDVCVELVTKRQGGDVQGNHVNFQCRSSENAKDYR